MTEVFLPRTDAAVAVQAIVAAAVLTSTLIIVRRDPDLRIFVIGVAVMTVAWFGVRSLH